jgi:uncharacterized protein YecT (DUF1311 family)
MNPWKAGGVVFAAASLLIAPSSVSADPVAECQTITSNQVETGQCLEDTLGTVEAVMGLALQHAQGKADSTDQVTGRPGARQALDRSQSSWAQFRAINCEVPGALAAGGSGSGQFITGCQIDMTRARTIELYAFASGP